MEAFRASKSEETEGTEKQKKQEMTSFSKKVYRLTKTIPGGKVMTYGQVAARIGKPKAVRAVGNALHHNPDPKAIPCHRVVNRKGGLALNFGFGGWREHKRRLLKEGIKFKNEKHVDLNKCLVKNNSIIQ